MTNACGLVGLDLLTNKATESLAWTGLIGEDQTEVPLTSFALQL